MTDFPDARADRSFFESVGKAEVPGTYSGNREASIKERLQSKRRRRREDIGKQLSIIIKGERCARLAGEGRRREKSKREEIQQTRRPIGDLWVAKQQLRSFAQDLE